MTRVRRPFVLNKRYRLAAFSTSPAQVQPDRVTPLRFAAIRSDRLRAVAAVSVLPSALRSPRHGETLRAMCNLYSITNLSLRRPQGRTATRRREAPREQEPKRQLMKGALRISPDVHASSKMSDICVPIMH